MSEWPKLYGVPEFDKDKAVPVIPADLGRELYEALNAVRQWVETPGLTLQGDDLPALLPALARYEREVSG